MIERDDDTEQALQLAPGFDLATFLAWRAPRAGTANPSRMDNPVWTWLVHTRLCGFRANEAMEGPCSTVVGPCWSFRRFGQARVILADGALVCIGGEHEDHDDPDFHIYNDVVVCCPDGSINVYTYPTALFEPLDFHSATLAGDQIVIIGALGYEQQRRYGRTPVYLLSLRSFAITRIDTAGEGPGWIARHAARLSADGRAIVISGGAVMPRAGAYPEANLDEWRLDLATWRWTCVRRCDWQRCIVAPADRRRNHLFDFRQALWETQGWTGGDGMAVERLAQALGMDPDLDLYQARYLMKGAAIALARRDGDDYKEFRVMLDGTVVRITEHTRALHVVVEGRLAEGRFAALVQHVDQALTGLLGTPCIVQLPQ
jgi:hypothetical protein